MSPFDNPPTPMYPSPEPTTMKLPTHRCYSTIAISPDAWAWLESEAVRRETSIEEVLAALVEQSRAVAVAAVEIRPADKVTL